MKAALALTLLLAVAASCALARPTDLDLARGRRAAQEDGGRGSVSGGVHREDGVGTVAKVEGRGNVWTSDDGKARVDATGEWSKVLDGPGRGKPSYGVGVKLSF